jgi:hypothetical protein
LQWNMFATRTTHADDLQCGHSGFGSSGGVISQEYTHFFVYQCRILYVLV